MQFPGSIDINKLVDMQDYDMLLKLIPKLIEAPMLSVLNASVLDPSVSSVFRLSQLGLQYLSFCLQFMDHTLHDLKTTMHHLQKVFLESWLGYGCIRIHVVF